MIILDAILGLILICWIAAFFGRYPLWRLALESLVGLVLIVAIHALVAFLLHKLGDFLDVNATTLESRRHMGTGITRKLRREAHVESLGDEELERHLERNPKDALALEIRCERLLKAGRRDEYARELAYLLTLPTRMSPEEQCSKLHWLADYYLLEIKRPDRAEEALRQIEARFPGTYQATLARQRILAVKAPSPLPLNEEEEHV